MKAIYVSDQVLIKYMHALHFLPLPMWYIILNNNASLWAEGIQILPVF